MTKEKFIEMVIVASYEIDEIKDRETKPEVVYEAFGRMVMALSETYERLDSLADVNWRDAVSNWGSYSMDSASPEVRAFVETILRKRGC